MTTIDAPVDDPFRVVVRGVVPPDLGRRCGAALEVVVVDPDRGPDAGERAALAEVVITLVCTAACAPDVVAEWLAVLTPLDLVAADAGLVAAGATAGQVLLADDPVAAVRGARERSNVHRAEDELGVWLTHAHGAGEQVPCAQLLGLVQPTDRVVEVGAGTGRRTRALVASVPEGRVLAVEADAASAELLTRTAPDAIVRQEAVTATAGQTVCVRLAADGTGRWLERVTRHEPGERLVSTVVADLVGPAGVDVLIVDVAHAPWVLDGAVLPGLAVVHVRAEDAELAAHGTDRAGLAATLADVGTVRDCACGAVLVTSSERDGGAS